MKHWSSAAARTVLDLDVPLCVDLDGTLVKGNTIYKAALSVLRRRPLYIFFLPFWLLRGQAYLWARLMDWAAIRVDLLPYRRELIDWLLEQKARGRSLALITGSNYRMAEAVAAHLGLFELVVGSRGVHLVGHEKSLELVRRFGEGGYDYVGDSRRDVPAWDTARECHTVAWAPTGNTPGRMGGKRTLSRRIRVFVRAIRVHQWVKNLLVFVPILLSHRILDLSAWRSAAHMFAAFCCLASATYVLNDLFDLEADRQHKSKRFRPIAAGELNIAQARLVMASLAAGGLILLAGMSWTEALIPIGYIAATLAYSAVLKQLALIDVLVLSGLYVARVMAGSAATNIVLSTWTAAFFMFVFFSLAPLKRYTELAGTPRTESSGEPVRRDYRQSDASLVSQVGVGSGMLAVLVFALYINSPDVRPLYRHPALLWLVCPLLMYLLGSMWLKAHRNEMHEDPVLFAIRDRSIYLTLILAGAVVALAG